MAKVFEPFLPDEDFPPDHDHGEAWLQREQILTMINLLDKGWSPDDFVIYCGMSIREFAKQPKFDRLVKGPHPGTTETLCLIADAAAAMRKLRKRLA